MDDSPPSVYRSLLDEAGEVTENILARLRRLHARYPSAVPTRVLEHLERDHHHPAGDRRAAVRLAGGPARVRIRPSPPRTGRVLDRSPGGVSLRLGHPVHPGTLMTVRWPAVRSGHGWYTIQVRHCRADGDGWVVGCEFVGLRPTG